MRMIHVMCVLAALICSHAAAATDGKPNIILIMADDVAYDNNFGSYGATESWTPRLDRMAEEGVRFAHAYSTPKCTPSRVKIMTGRSGIRNYFRFMSLKRGETTFAHVLKKAGYRTMAAGKWQLDGVDGTRPGEAGFDEWLLWNTELATGDRYWNPQFERNGKKIDAPAGAYGPDMCVREILDFIDRRGEEPFFVYYPMLLVHAPFLPTPDSVDRGETDKQKNFADMLRYLDKCVGRILDHVDEQGLGEETLILFTSDNGTDRSLTYTSFGELVRGKKGIPHDRGTHAPLLVRQPGVVPAGRVTNEIVDFSDVLPTLAEVADAELPDVTLDGRSFYPQILGKPGNPREWIYQYYWPKGWSWIPPELGTSELIWAQNQRYKLYANGLFYDLKADREEQHPIPPEKRTGEQKAAAKMLREAIQSMPETNEHFDGRPAQTGRESE